MFDARKGPAALAPKRPPVSLSRRQILAALVVGGWLTACGRSQPQVFHGIDLTGAGFGRDFRLFDPDGKPRRLADFRGQVVVLFFGFTQCPHVCPTAMARAAEARKRLGAAAARVQVLFVTLDPERDSGEILGAFTRGFDPSFIGLRDEAPGIQAVTREFQVFSARIAKGAGYDLDHTALTYLFDAAGRLRVALRPEQTAEDLAADIRALL